MPLFLLVFLVSSAAPVRFPTSLLSEITLWKLLLRMTQALAIVTKYPSPRSLIDAYRGTFLPVGLQPFIYTLFLSWHARGALCATFSLEPPRDAAQEEGRGGLAYWCRRVDRLVFAPVTPAN